MNSFVTGKKCKVVSHNLVYFGISGKATKY